MRKVIILLLACLVLSGCATSGTSGHQSHFKPGFVLLRVAR
ncbi:MAG: hypothetical protein WCV68_04440 [Candidatus Paceibacterota bacterium]